VDPNKIAIIQRVPPPQKVRDVRSVLHLARYYQRFIKDFSKLASPLFGILGKDVLGKVLDKCIEMNLSLKLEKCEFFMTEVTMLGHAIS